MIHLKQVVKVHQLLKRVTSKCKTQKDIKAKVVTLSGTLIARKC